MNKKKPVLVMSALAAVILLGGCSQVSKEEPVRNQPDIRDERTVQEEVEKASAGILDLMGLKGKVTKSGAVSVACSDYPPQDEVHRMRHPWSIYQVPREDLKRAMAKLRDELPGKGWEIVKDGPDESKARLPQILANSRDGRLSVDLRLWEEPAGSERSSMLEVTVVSDCFRSKPGAGGTG